MNKINVLSLFDGLAGARIALDRLNIPCNYYASEIDKYAIQVSDDNYPDIIRLGDVRELSTLSLPKIDLLIGGSPCTNFSFAGKRAGMTTKCKEEILDLNHYLQLKKDNFKFEGQSYLFWEYMRIKHELMERNPDLYFLLENVMMVDKWKQVLSKAISVEPIQINSALVSAQNRKRLYWTNIEGIEQPEDKGITFQQILDSDEARIKKSYALTRTYFKKGGEATRQRNFIKCQRPIAWIDDVNTRWLTPNECERLQTVPLNFTACVSNTQRFMMLGNGWNVDTIVHMFRNIPWFLLGDSNG